METSTLLSILLVLIVLAIYKFIARNNEVFKKRGVDFEQPSFFFGNMLDVFLGKIDEDSLFEYLYEKFSREKIFGVFVLHNPVFVIKDVELARQIMSQHHDSFDSFAGSDSGEAFGRTLSSSISFLRGSEWTAMRSTLNKIYANSAMQKLYQNFLCCADRSLSFIHTRCRNGQRTVIDTKELFDKYCADVIATAVLDINSSDKALEVLEITKCIESDLTSFSASIKLLVNSMLPKCFSMKMFRKQIEDFFDKNLAQEIRGREAEKVTSNDDNMMELLIASASPNTGAASSHFSAFFAGGSTSKLLQMCFFELASDQETQRELINEIDRVVDNLKGQLIEYENVKCMKLLENVILETLRKNPPLTVGTRVCTKDCSVITRDGESFKFIKDDVLHIPFRLIHSDPKYFPTPEKFNPCRFHDAQAIHSLFAFGFGSRSCLGENFVMLQSKLVVFTLLSKYSIHTCDKTPESTSPSTDNENIFLNFVRRQ